MVEGLLLVDGTGVDKERLRSFSLANAKQLVLGHLGAGNIVHVAANSSEDLGKAVAEFSRVAGVTAVMTLAIRNN